MALYYPIFFFCYTGCMAIFGVRVFAQVKGVKYAVLGWVGFMVVLTAPLLAIDQSLLWLENHGLQELTSIVVVSLVLIIILLRCIVGFLNALRDCLHSETTEPTIIPAVTQLMLNFVFAYFCIRCCIGYSLLLMDSGVDSGVDSEVPSLF